MRSTERPRRRGDERRRAFEGGGTVLALEKGGGDAPPAALGGAVDVDGGMEAILPRRGAPPAGAVGMEREANFWVAKGSERTASASSVASLNSTNSLRLVALLVDRSEFQPIDRLTIAGRKAMDSTSSEKDAHSAKGQLTMPPVGWQQWLCSQRDRWTMQLPAPVRIVYYFSSPHSTIFSSTIRFHTMYPSWFK